MRDDFNSEYRKEWNAELGEVQRIRSMPVVRAIRWIFTPQLNL